MMSTVIKGLHLISTTLWNYIQAVQCIIYCVHFLCSTQGKGSLFAFLPVYCWTHPPNCFQSPQCYTECIFDQTPPQPKGKYKSISGMLHTGQRHCWQYQNALNQAESVQYKWKLTLCDLQGQWVLFVSIQISSLYFPKLTTLFTLRVLWSGSVSGVHLLGMHRLMCIWYILE